MKEKSKRDDMIKLLNETGYGESEAFYRVAQAISETLPIVEAVTDGRISNQEIEDKIKEAFRQLGIEIVLED